MSHTSPQSSGEVTITLGPDELLTLAPILAKIAPQHAEMTREATILARLLLAAGDVLHAQRADRHERKR